MKKLQLSSFATRCITAQNASNTIISFSNQSHNNISFSRKLILSFIFLSIFYLTASASGTYTVGAGATYSTLKAAFDDINIGAISGAIELQVIASTTETASAVLNASGGSASYTSVKIYPTGTGKTITSNGAWASIDLNGADNVTIDGSENQAGTLSATDNLTITNNNVAGTTIRLSNGATNNFVKYCNIKGAYVTGTDLAAGGVIVFSSTGGNSNNTIDHNNITFASTKPINVIYSAGSASNINSTNTISNNNIYDFGKTTTDATLKKYNYGILLADYNTAWTINGNSFYESAVIKTDVKFGYIFITNTSGAGDAFNVSDNYIGGTSAQCSGTALTHNTNNATFIGIYLKVGTTTTSNVQGNIIKNISWTNSAANTFTGIQIDGGNVNVGGTNVSEGNIIGTQTTPVLFSTTGNNTNSATGILSTGAGIVTIQNNTIAYFSGGSTNAAPGSISIIGINKTSTVNAFILNNMIDNVGLNANSSNVANGNVYAISNGAASGTTASILNNTITNLFHNGATPTIRGIYQATSNNTSGILTFSGNFISDFTAPNATDGILSGIYVINGNYDLNNNIISLTSNGVFNMYGVNYNGSAGGAGSLKLYFNTIYIAGETLSGTKLTAAYYNSTNVVNRYIQNNIFVNSRNGATAKHYSMYFNNTTAPTTMNNNDCFVSGTGGVLAGVTTTDKTGFPFFTSDAGVITDPAFASPSTTPASYMPTTFVDGITIANYGSDFGTNTRAATPKIGAWEPAPVIWDGATWNTTPTSSLNAILDGNYSGVGFSCLDLTVNAGKQFSLASGTLSVGGNLTLKSDITNGTATFIDNDGNDNTGTLVVTGQTYVEQYLTSGRNWYISSPVTGATSNVMTASSTKPMYWYNETLASNNWTSISNTSTALEATKGYIANVANTGNVTFTGGTLNTGDKTSTTLTRTEANTASSGFNLVGNPYPSFLNMNEFATDNVIVPSYWIRSKNGANYVFDTYNIPSGLTTGNSGLSVTANVPPLQAFWVRVKNGVSSGTITFTNAMRGHKDEANNKFRAPSAKTNEQQVLRLKVSNAVNSDEAIVYFNVNAMDEYDGYDSPKMAETGKDRPQIFTTTESERLVINGMNKLSDNLTIPLGFSSGETNTFSITPIEITNFAADTKIILKDKIQNSELELTEGTDYTFTSDAVNTLNRFSIIFRSPNLTTNTINPNEGENIAVYNSKKGEITIHCNSLNREDCTVKIYNLMGKQILSEKLTGNITSINKSFNTGIYLVVVNNAGKNTIKKLTVN